MLIEISKKPASFLDVSDPTWVDSKHARQNRVGCDGIIREQNDVQIRVAVMTGVFSDGYGSGSQPQKRFGRAADQLSVSIHGSAEDVLHQVGFEQDGFTPNVQIERPDPVINQLFKAVGVLVSRKNRNARA